jgi:hypothetical protein
MVDPTGQRTVDLDGLSLADHKNAALETLRSSIDSASVPLKAFGTLLRSPEIPGVEGPLAGKWGSGGANYSEDAEGVSGGAGISHKRMHGFSVSIDSVTDASSQVTNVGASIGILSFGVETSFTNGQLRQKPYFDIGPATTWPDYLNGGSKTVHASDLLFNPDTYDFRTQFHVDYGNGYTTIRIDESLLSKP